MRKNLPHDHNNIWADKMQTFPAIAQFDLLAETFKLLGDSTRVHLFWLLCHCEECVLNLSVMMDMSSPAISHHLKLLKTSGLVISRRSGKEVFYKAAETELARALHEIIENVMEITCPVRELHITQNTCLARNG